ncbi:MAG: translesion DNA synthesis-associated protein ImuA [Pseudomonadota bacterium]
MIAFADAATPFKPAPAMLSANAATDLATKPAEACTDKLSNLPEAVWRANQMGASKAHARPSGYACLDRELPNGGWPASILIELLLSQNGIGELRLLAPTMAALTQAGKTVILLAPPHIPFAPALAELGLNLQHVLLIQTEKPMDRIWAVEQTLKSANFGALLCWLPQARPDHLRRLQLAAGSGEGLCFVFRPAAAQHESSPAPLRITCRASRCGGIEVDIIKRRGPVFGKPINLPLQVPEALTKPFARQAGKPVAVSPIFSHAADHVVDSPELAAAAARYRPAVAA